MLRGLLSFWIGLSLVISACGANRTISALGSDSQVWSYNDLRSLDPAEAIQPSVDLIAAYTQLDGTELRLRLDLLDLTEIPDQDLYIALDFSPGGSKELPIQTTTDLAWDTLLVVPAQSPLQALAPGTVAGQFGQRPHTGLRVQRDSSLDTITISLNRAAIRAEPDTLQNFPDLRIEVISTLSGSPFPTDRLESFSVTAPPPSPARTLLVFWNSLPVYTPLQALRRWDGAHTGPLGGRHGLYNLLRTTRNAGAPVFLLDLNQPAMLSALDALDGTGLVLEMATTDLLGLPTALPGFPDGIEIPALLQPPAWAQARVMRENTQITHDFGLQSTPFVFFPSGFKALHDLSVGDMPTQRHIAFLPAESDSTSAQAADTLELAWPIKWKDWLVLPVPGYRVESESTTTEQATLDGPSLAVRRALAAAAQAVSTGQAAQSPLLFLGGDLPASDWGNPEAARVTLKYIQNHPWIKLLGPSDLKSMPSAGEMAANLTPPEATAGPGDQILLEGLRYAPANSLGTAAWQAYQAAFTPVYPLAPALPALRAIYARQIGMLLEGARWAENPHPISSCDLDPDQDGQPECILSSEHVFAAFELDHGGYLAYLFALVESDEAHQIIAPSGLLSSGTSPADTWDLSLGIFADPQTLPGAFWETDSPANEPAKAQLGSSFIRLSARLSSSGNSLVKTFRLLPNGIEARITGLGKGVNYHTSLPITLDPWLRLQPGWVDRYTSQLDGQSWHWGSQPGQLVEIQTDSAISLSTSTDHLQLLGAPENPNREVPAGFRLPFPLAEIILNTNDDFSATIRLVK